MSTTQIVVMGKMILPIPNLEEWARRTLSEALISEWEFQEELLRVGRLGRRYGFEELREHDLERGVWPLDEIYGDGEYGDWRHCQICHEAMPYAACRCPHCGQMYNERLEPLLLHPATGAWITG